MHRYLTGMALGLLCSATQAEFVPDDPSSYVTRELLIEGDVQQAQRYSLEQLQALPGQDVTSLAATCPGSSPELAEKGYNGVRLRDLLQKTTLSGDDPKAWKRAYIVARASDDYVALFTWNELFNSNGGDAVVVAVRQHGQPLADESGKIALISGCDHNPGPRHVKWLKSVELHLVP
ncbi:molybdopterin-dependent oxidoreductase [Pseudomonas sp. LRF_L74]|uniref:molybdopterin-dependent oxidoreductase n=1 Tax=Pseudomonas sp. LRF_L74 TaxID=3369422 RepID=UPI003F615643